MSATSTPRKLYYKAYGRVIFAVLCAVFTMAFMQLVLGVVSPFSIVGLSGLSLMFGGGVLFGSGFAPKSWGGLGFFGLVTAGMMSLAICSITGILPGVAWISMMGGWGYFACVLSGTAILPAIVGALIQVVERFNGNRQGTSVGKDPMTRPDFDPSGVFSQSSSAGKHPQPAFEDSRRGTLDPATPVPTILTPQEARKLGQ